MKSQRIKLLELLKKSPNGINSYYATYTLGIKQAPTRIKELRELGHNIQSIQNKDRSVNWILSSEARLHAPEPSLKDQYIFLPNGTAILRTNIEPRQLEVGI